jgi:hypothetical protein
MKGSSSQKRGEAPVENTESLPSGQDLSPAVRKVHGCESEKMLNGTWS